MNDTIDIRQRSLKWVEVDELAPSRPNPIKSNGRRQYGSREDYEYVDAVVRVDA